jgi:hypothetical protein
MFSDKEFSRAWEMWEDEFEEIINIE